MEIKAITKYDLEAYTALIHIWFFKKANPIRQIWLNSIFNIGFIALAISLKMPFAPYILLFLLVELLYLYLYFIIPKIQYKSAKKFAGISNTFTFKDDELTIESQSPEYSGSANIKYSMIFKVMETSRYFFIYQNKGQAYVVDKRNIENGTFLDIRNKLVCTVPAKKYIICKY